MSLSSVNVTRHKTSFGGGGGVMAYIRYNILVPELDIRKRKWPGKDKVTAVLQLASPR